MLLANGTASFDTFATPHLAAMGVTAIAAVGCGFFGRGSERRARVLGCVIAGVLLAAEAAEYAVGLSARPVVEVVRHQLPLHVCDAAVFLTAWALLRRSWRAFEIAYFWGLGGTIQAILTPDLTVNYPGYWFFAFFIGHGGIIVGVVFCLWALKLRPRPGAVWRVLIVTNVFLAIVAAANWLLDANYMFLCRRPDGASPFFFLDWPWYIAFLELVGVTFICLLYLPFYIRNRRSTQGD